MTDQEKLKQAKRLALKFSRELPYRLCSPYGHKDTDDEKAMEAFRLCYEVLLKLN